MRFLVAGFLAAVLASPGLTYDPLQLPRDGAVHSLELEVPDLTTGEARPLLIHLDDVPGSHPVVLFSHGLGGSRDVSAYLGRHWAARGYVAVFLQHPGSDARVWKQVPRGERKQAMIQAASGRNLRRRLEDVQDVLDALTEWNRQSGNPLYGLLDMETIGMSGHSFGAVTTQAVGGQSRPFGRIRETDRRIRAALPMSPSCPRFGDPETAFASVTIPWLLMTGTRDISPLGGADLESRLGVYPSLPATIPRYELVLDGARHSAFTDHELTPEAGERNPHHHRSILALSTAFWDAYLRHDMEAIAWLHGPEVRSALQPADRWRWEPALTPERKQQ